MPLNEIFGHILGTLGVILFFISYQVKAKKSLLILQTIATSFMCLQYVLIGAYSGFALNIICAIRNVVLFVCENKSIKSIWIPLFLAFLMPVAGILSWEGPISLFIWAGLMINTVCMGVLNTQKLRFSIVLTSSLIIIYNVLASSYTGLINESISIASSIIGIIRFHKSMSRN